MRTELVEKLKNKKVFFDFDGTLSEFRFCNMVGPEYDTEEILNRVLFENVYDDVRPLKTMQEVVKVLDRENVYILGAVIINNEIEEKYIWLANNYPSIKKENMFFVNNSQTKLSLLEAFRKKYGLDYKDMVLIDDKHSTIQKAEEMGYIAYHPSSFID